MISTVCHHLRGCRQHLVIRQGGAVTSAWGAESSLVDSGEGGTSACSGSYKTPKLMPQSHIYQSNQSHKYCLNDLPSLDYSKLTRQLVHSVFKDDTQQTMTILCIAICSHCFCKSPHLSPSLAMFSCTDTLLLISRALCVTT